MSQNSEAKDNTPSAEEILARPVCPLTWLTNDKSTVLCAEHECAWFDIEAGACSILSISQALRSVGFSMGNISMIASMRASRDQVI